MHLGGPEQRCHWLKKQANQECAYQSKIRRSEEGENSVSLQGGGGKNQFGEYK